MNSKTPSAKAATHLQAPTSEGNWYHRNSSDDPWKLHLVSKNGSTGYLFCKKLGMSDHPTLDERFSGQWKKLNATAGPRTFSI